MFDERRRPVRQPVGQPAGKDHVGQIDYSEWRDLTAVTKNVYPTLAVDRISFTSEGEPVQDAHLGLRAEEPSPNEVIIVGVLEPREPKTIFREHNTMFLARYNPAITKQSPGQLVGLVLVRPAEAESLTYAVIPGARGSIIGETVRQQMRDFFEPKGEDEEGEPKEGGLRVEEIPLEDITVLERAPASFGEPSGKPMVVIKLMEQTQGANRGRVMPTIRRVV